MKNKPNKATVKDGLPTAERILNDHLWMGTEPTEAQSAILAAMQSYSDQQNAELRDRLTKIQDNLQFEKDLADDALNTQEEQLIALRNQIADLERENSEYRAVYDSVVKNRDEMSGKLQSETESRKHWQRQSQRYQKYHKELNAALERVKELESELEHHKRVIFSLQTDLENKKWFDVYEKDLIFLREMLERFEKSDRDVTQREYVEQMLKDWIAELEAK